MVSPDNLLPPIKLSSTIATTNPAHDIMCLNTNSVLEYMYLSTNCAHDYMHLKTNDHIYFNINVPMPTCIYIQMIIMITCFYVYQWC